MARLLGVILPDNKRIEYALTMLYGIGWANVKKILSQASVNANTKVGKLTEDEVKKITAIIEKDFKVEGDLRQEHTESLKRLREIGTYRGLRHLRSLPVRGQRTRSNARTKRGKRKTVGALKKEVWAKMEQGGAAQKPAEAK